jgi:glycosyltransferase involved in cell wall biosynthesis
VAREANLIAHDTSLSPETCPKSIAIVTLWMLDPRGKGFQTGGVERWTRDCAYVLADAGFDVTIYQKGMHDFETAIDHGVRVRGLNVRLDAFGNLQMYKRLRRLLPSDAAILFVASEIYCGSYFTNAIVVNHGIWWHSDFPRWKRVVIRYFQKLILDHARGVICVDTAYINWCHTEVPRRSKWRARLVYVPNYADTTVFKPNGNLESRSPRCRILVPRRMQGKVLDSDPRGSGFILGALEELDARGVEVDVTFAGRGNLSMEVASRSARFRSVKVNVMEASMDEMPQHYREHDIVVIPSCATEGTSLAAVEALCSGNTVIVTHIGGLANLVVPGFNGLISDLNPRSLAEAIQKACNMRLDPLIVESSRRAFSMERWRSDVVHTIQRLLTVS